MKHRYRISPKGRGAEPSDQELARLADGKRLLFEYQRATKRPTVPIYRDPKAFLALLIIALIAWLLSSGALEHGPEQEPQPASEGTEVPTNVP